MKETTETSNRPARKVEIRYADRSTEVFTTRRIDTVAYSSLLGTGSGLKRVVAVKIY